MGFVDKQPSRIQGQWFLVESMKYGFFEQAERPYIGLLNDYWRQIHPKRNNTFRYCYVPHETFMPMVMMPCHYQKMMVHNRSLKSRNESTFPLLMELYMVT